MRKILCFFGWHSWTWKLTEGETINLDTPPPKHSFCEYCYKDYSDEK